MYLVAVNWPNGCHVAQQRNDVLGELLTGLSIVKKRVKLICLGGKRCKRHQIKLYKRTMFYLLVFAQFVIVSLPDLEQLLFVVRLITGRVRNVHRIRSSHLFRLQHVVETDQLRV